jgi:hypothetical protein
MNPKDEAKIKDAAGIVTLVEAPLEDIARRGPGAVKAWIAQMPNLDATQQAKLKNDVVTPAVKLIKDIKAVLKDLESLYKEGTDAKKLAAYADGKAFRAKPGTKYLVAAKQFELDSLKCTTALKNVIGKGYVPAGDNTDVTIFVTMVEKYSKSLTSLKMGLNKL